MSIRKDHRVVVKHPTGVGIIKAPAGGPQQMTCPVHKLACTPTQTPNGLIWNCPRGHQLGSKPI